MSFEVKGKLEIIYDETKVTDKFRKREFVLMIQEGAYPEYPKFQLIQDKCNLLDQFKIGDEVMVSFNLRGKPFTKNYTNLEVWKIVHAGMAETKTATAATFTANSSTPASRASTENQSGIVGITFSEASDDELPF
ncbi:MAG: DUF3127 domain-containing protein [Flammeovirgaceae bacterium]|nr:DUF3127 domain-containing protein [Flammeovirgaceae bacterium]MDW8287942.1 DUF3127 domain-containing protein [Flammeovirgaceae bacterium]